MLARRSRWKAARSSISSPRGLKPRSLRRRRLPETSTSKIGGGVFTVRQYLQAGLIDELHFAIAPVVLGGGEAIFYGVDMPGLGFRVTEHAATGHATHLVLSR